jgi:hypothetical protein
VNIETKQQSKQWMHTHPPNKPEKFKQMLPVCQKAGGNCILGQEGSSDVEFMQQGTTVASQMCCETLKKLCSIGHSE